MTKDIAKPSSADLIARYGTWGDHPDYPDRDWRDDTGTRLGYWEWVAAKLADPEDSDDENPFDPESPEGRAVDRGDMNPDGSMPRPCDAPPSQVKQPPATGHLFSGDWRTASLGLDAFGMPRGPGGAAQDHLSQPETNPADEYAKIREFCGRDQGKAQ